MNQEQLNNVLFEFARFGELDIVKAIVKAGADTKFKNSEALRFAATNGHLDVVKYLSKAGADINARNKESLHLSAKNGHTAVAEYLKNYHN